jgi:hypothetical protein
MTLLPSLDAKFGVLEDDDNNNKESVSMSESENSEDSESKDSEVLNQSLRVAR